MHACAPEETGEKKKSGQREENETQLKDLKCLLCSGDILPWLCNQAQV